VCVLISLDMSVGGRKVKWLSTTLGKPQGGAPRGGEMLKVPSRLPVVFYLYMFDNTLKTKAVILLLQGKISLMTQHYPSLFLCFF
jgi:hypothetical protein